MGLKNKVGFNNTWNLEAVHSNAYRRIWPLANGKIEIGFLGIVVGLLYLKWDQIRLSLSE